MDATQADPPGADTELGTQAATPHALADALDRSDLPPMRATAGICIAGHAALAVPMIP